MLDKKECNKCGKILPLVYFFPSKRIDKYPDGHLSECKKCITLNVDENNPETYLWILKEIDTFYMKSKWDQLKKIHPDIPILSRYVAWTQLLSLRQIKYEDSVYYN